MGGPKFPTEEEIVLQNKTASSGEWMKEHFVTVPMLYCAFIWSMMTGSEGDWL